MVDIEAVPSALADVLHEAREREELERPDVANQIRGRSATDIEPRTVASYEYRSREVTVRRLLQLGAVYGTPASVLLANAQTGAEQRAACPPCGHPSLLEPR